MRASLMRPTPNLPRLSTAPAIQLWFAVLLPPPQMIFLDVGVSAGYGSGMKTTRGEYLTIGPIQLVMATTLAGVGIRIYLAFTGG
ncbi:hypothetical protein [Sinorhizobium fredii]|uniref:hypothetical protein n=1 Tax=Rhizobium fredii TaxID=380 RepID=UPI00129503C0|nr:hypothetical protein [Sinorhizobium fredii]MQW99591.1 hypothetical protein [Sinorhizobium fredii]